MTIFFSTMWLIIQALSFTSSSSDKKVSDPADHYLTLSMDGGMNWVHFDYSTRFIKRPVGLWGDASDVFVSTGEDLFHISPTRPLPSMEQMRMPHVPVSRLFVFQDETYVISQWNGIYKRDPFTDLWLPITKDHPEKFFHSVFQQNDGTLLACGEHGLYRSSDSGTTWRRVLQNGNIREIMEHRGMLIGYGMYGIWQSKDQGVTWENKFNPGSNTIYLSSSEDGLYVIMSGVELAGITLPNTVWRSTDSGESWSQADFNLPTELSSIHRLLAHEGNLVAASGRGIFVSQDGGKTWMLAQKPVENAGGFYELIKSNDTLYSLYIVGC